MIAGALGIRSYQDQALQELGIIRILRMKVPVLGSGIIKLGCY